MAPTALSRASTIGWIGLGAMGHHMALNLFTKTYLAYHQSTVLPDPPEFLICESDTSRVDNFLEQLKQKGGSDLSRRVNVAGNGREMAMGASRILTMLPSTPQVESVYLDPQTGILSGIPESAPSLGPEHPSLAFESSDATETNSETITGVSAVGPHTLLIDGTTLDPTAAIRIAKQIQDSTNGGALMMDAPVSGGIVAAEAGKLTIMFGSPSDQATDLAVPFLQRMARPDGVIHCGGNGAGVGVKVANNLILAINQIALAEGFALGKSLGIDAKLLHDVINTSSGQSWSSRVNSPLAEVANSPGSRSFSGGFQSRLMLKDVGLALSAAHTYDLPTPLGWAAKSVYDAVCAENDGELATKDFSSVYEWLKRKQEQGVERGWKDGKPEI